MSKKIISEDSAMQPDFEAAVQPDFEAENLNIKNENDDLLLKNLELQNAVDALEKEIAKLKNKPQLAAPVEFERDGKKYQVLSAATIPHLGRRTAAEIAVDDEAQDYLIQKESGVIREIK